MAWKLLPMNDNCAANTKGESVPIYRLQGLQLLLPPLLVRLLPSHPRPTLLLSESCCQLLDAVALAQRRATIPIYIWGKAVFLRNKTIHWSALELHLQKTTKDLVVLVLFFTKK